MKTPQEIAAEIVMPRLDANDWTADAVGNAIETAITAAREEGRRAGLEEAAAAVRGYVAGSDIACQQYVGDWLRAALKAIEVRTPERAK